jgi:hypothetical protein
MLRREALPFVRRRSPFVVGRSYRDVECRSKNKKVMKQRRSKRIKLKEKVTLVAMAEFKSKIASLPPPPYFLYCPLGE